jgi:hypothetical protein
MLLKPQQVENYGITEFVQGQTRRWAVAWSYGDIRLPDVSPRSSQLLRRGADIYSLQHLARISNPTLRHLMPTHTILREPVPPGTHLIAVHTILGPMLGVTVTSEEPATQALLCTAPANTWSRAMRRRLAGTAIAVVANPLVVVRVALVQEAHGAALVFTWVRGHDGGAFESFCSHVARKVRNSGAGA